jgi:nickel transport protein
MDGMQNTIHKLRWDTKASLMKGCALSLFLWLALCGNALAHRVTIFAWVEGDTVYTESKTGSGAPLQNATIRVLDNQGKQLLTGRTDAEGAFSFKTSQKTDLTVVSEASMGHRAEWTIPAQELVGSSGGPSRPAQDSTPTETTKGGEEFSKNVVIGMDRQELEALINQILDRKLTPVLRQLSELTHGGPTTTEVVGGFGYIFGLVGIALYIFNRKKNKPSS